MWTQLTAAEARLTAHEPWVKAETNRGRKIRLCQKSILLDHLLLQEEDRGEEDSIEEMMAEADSASALSTSGPHKVCEA